MYYNEIQGYNQAKNIEILTKSKFLFYNKQNVRQRFSSRDKTQECF